LFAEFFFACCQSAFYWQYVSGSQIQATIQNVSAEKYANLWLPCPSLEVQSAITAFLDRETAKIETLIAEAQQAINLLKERRGALISAAVTGKIDVRGVQV
jgi:restriction endonuclease S subunit